MPVEVTILITAEPHRSRRETAVWARTGGDQANGYIVFTLFL